MVINSVAVCIPTRYRPDKLRLALDSVVAQHGLELTVIVVDNGPDGATETVCREHATRPRYVVEERPGVAHVRNVLLTTADRLGVDAAVFLDDDSQFGDGAIVALVKTAEAYPGDLVAGPVTYEWEPRPDGSVPMHPIPIERPDYADGTSVPTTGTANTLIPLKVWRAVGRPLFDPNFGKSGGEDTEFFYRLRTSGLALRWCAGSVVVEQLPESRASPEELAKRYVRAGHINGVLALRTRTRARVLAESVGRLFVGALLMPWPRPGRSVAPHPRATFYSGVGRFRAAVGRPPFHYGGPE